MRLLLAALLALAAAPASSEEWARAALQAVGSTVDLDEVVWSVSGGRRRTHAQVHFVTRRGRYRLQLEPEAIEDPSDVRIAKESALTAEQKRRLDALLADKELSALLRSPKPVYGRDRRSESGLFWAILRGARVHIGEPCAAGETGCVPIPPALARLKSSLLSLEDELRSRPALSSGSAR